MIFRLIPFFCLAALLMLSGTAHAQVPAADRYGSGAAFDEHGVPYSNKYYRSQPKDNVISLVRKPELTEDQFILRITNPYTLSGCADISNYGFWTEYRDVYLDVTIGSMKVDLRDQPQYAHFQCNRQAKIPTADIVINRQDLIDNETRQIRLHNGADTNYYNIELGANRVKILPETAGSYLAMRFKPHNLSGRKTALTYWFYPVGTMVLWVPGMENTPQTRARLNDFARSKGLEPLQSVLPEFESPLTNSQFQYYVDTGGQFDNMKSAMSDGAPLGMIKVEKTAFGLDKDYTVTEEKTVFAKTPGLYD